MKRVTLTKAVVKKIHGAVDAMFDRAKARFLARPPVDKRIVIGFKPRVSLPDLFRAASMEERAKADEDLLRGLLDIAEGFVESIRSATKAHVVRSVESFLNQAHAKGVQTDVSTVLGGELASVFGKATDGMRRVLDTEASNVRNTGLLDGIVKVNAGSGIDDPVVYFVVVRDNVLCGECRRLHLMPDGVTPRLWRLSEVGRGYHKKGQDTPKIGGLHPHCFAGEERLYTQDGMMTFQELYDLGLPVRVAVDRRIRNRRVGNNQFGAEIPGATWFHRHEFGTRFLQATHVYDTGVQPCLRLVFDTGQSMVVSYGHEMWIDDGASGKKVRAGDLHVGEKVPLMSGPGGFGTDHFPELAELMGNLMGDGSIGRSAEWRFFGDDIEYGVRLKKMASAFSERLSKKMTILPPDDKYNVPRATFNSVVLGCRFVKEFGISKKPRRVPRRLWGADKDTVAAFLRGLYAADGHSEDQLCVVLAQNDRVFLGEVQLLLANFGLRARVFDHGEECEKWIRYADESTYITNRKKCWRLVLGGWEQADQFAKEIGMGVFAKQEELLRRVAATADKAPHGAWRTTRVVLIEDVGEKQTYCLTEPMTNTVSVNGVVTGQCRCTLVTLLPGYGFDAKGGVDFKSLDHDEFKRQRGQGFRFGA